MWFFEQDWDKAIASLNKKRDEYEDRITRLEKRVTELQDAHYKDKEIQRMKESMEHMKEDYYRGFPITEKESEDIGNWMVAHIDKAHGGALRGGAVGGVFTYKFIPTSIGVVGEIHCICGEHYTFKELE